MGLLRPICAPPDRLVGSKHSSRERQLRKIALHGSSGRAGRCVRRCWSGRVRPAQARGTDDPRPGPSGPRRQARDLAAAALSIAVGHADGATHALLHVTHARALAALGERQAAARALLAAEDAIARDGRPQAGYSLLAGPAAGTFASRTARALTEVGDHTGAEARHRAAFTTWGPAAFPRGFTRSPGPTSATPSPPRPTVTVTALPAALDSHTLLVAAVIVHDEAAGRVLLLQCGPRSNFAPAPLGLSLGKGGQRRARRRRRPRTEGRDRADRRSGLAPSGWQHPRSLGCRGTQRVPHRQLCRPVLAGRTGQLRTPQARPGRLVPR